MKITGIRAAVKDYKEANAGGAYSPRYGYLMLDRNSGEIWTDEFYSLGHNNWKNYNDPAIINIEPYIDGKVTMQTVKETALRLCEEWRKETK